MSNFFDDYLKLNPLEDKLDKSTEKEETKDDELIEGEGGAGEDDE